jgi:hypothetical protein
MAETDMFWGTMTMSQALADPHSSQNLYNMSLAWDQRVPRIVPPLITTQAHENEFTQTMRPKIAQFLLLRDLRAQKITLHNVVETHQKDPLLNDCSMSDVIAAHIGGMFGDTGNLCTCRRKWISCANMCKHVGFPSDAMHTFSNFAWRQSAILMHKHIRLKDLSDINQAFSTASWIETFICSHTQN